MKRILSTFFLLTIIAILFSCNGKDDEYVFPYTGAWAGTYSGMDKGTWQADITTDGKFTGTAASNLAPDFPLNINGTVSNTGVIEASYTYIGVTASFMGQITGDEVVGTWSADTLNIGGTWEGSKQ